MKKDSDDAVENLRKHEEELREKYKNCKHPYLKHGVCDYCGKDLIGE